MQPTSCALLCGVLYLLHQPWRLWELGLRLLLPHLDSSSQSLWSVHLWTRLTASHILSSTLISASSSSRAAPPPLSGAHRCLDLHIHFVNLSASSLVSGRYGLNVPTSGREYGKADCNGTQNQGLLEGERGLGRGTRGMWRRTGRGQTGTKYKTKCHRETYY